MTRGPVVIKANERAHFWPFTETSKELGKMHSIWLLPAALSELPPGPDAHFDAGDASKCTGVDRRVLLRFNMLNGQIHTRLQRGADDDAYYVALNGGPLDLAPRATQAGLSHLLREIAPGKDEIARAQPPPGIGPGLRLFPHQEQALTWMLSKESHTGPMPGARG